MFLRAITLPTTNVSIIEEPYENYTIEDSAIRKKYKKLIDNPLQSYTYGEAESGTNKSSHIDKVKVGRESSDGVSVAKEDGFYQGYCVFPTNASGTCMTSNLYFQCHVRG